MDPITKITKITHLRIMLQALYLIDTPARLLLTEQNVSGLHSRNLTNGLLSRLMC
jgi:hypothetical protein